MATFLWLEKMPRDSTENFFLFGDWLQLAVADTFDCKAFAQIAWWKAVCLQTLQHRLTAVPLRQFSDSVLVSVHWWAHIVCKASLWISV